MRTFFTLLLLNSALFSPHVTADSLDNLIWMQKNLKQYEAPLQERIANGDSAALQELAEEYFSFFCCSGEHVRDSDEAKNSLNYLIGQHKEGNADLEFSIGQFYNFGLGTPKNDRLAFEWWLKSANNGNSEAQNNIAIFYERGYETKKDTDKALLWYTKSAEQGNTNAHTNIGILYFEGIGRAIDYQEALRWFKKAAEAAKQDDDGDRALNYIREVEAELKKREK